MKYICDLNIKINYIQRTRLFTNNNKQNMLIIFLSNFPLKMFFKKKNLHLKWNVEQIYNSNIITMKIPCINNGIMCNKYTPSKLWQNVESTVPHLIFVPNHLLHSLYSTFRIWSLCMKPHWFETMLINCFHRLIYHTG